MIGRIPRSYMEDTMRKFVLTLTLVALTAPMAAPPVLAQTDHSGHDMSQDMGDHATMAGGVQAEATINSVSGDILNVTHGPIPEIGWPAMTMDLGLLEGAQIESVEAGQEVMMTLEKGPDGMFGIRALAPKE